LPQRHGSPLARLAIRRGAGELEIIMTHLHDDLPPITLIEPDVAPLRALASAAVDTFPQTAEFLANEVERAEVVASSVRRPGLVVMGSRLEFRDDTTGQVRRVTLVYPDEADIDAGRISVLTPIGAALIGLSVGQSIEWQTPSGGTRSLTVLAVDGPAGAWRAERR
jgi:regulator of nucleoside diphosphate kinase